MGTENAGKVENIIPKLKKLKLTKLESGMWLVELR